MIDCSKRSGFAILISFYYVSIYYHEQNRYFENLREDMKYIVLFFTMLRINHASLVSSIMVMNCR